MFVAWPSQIVSAKPAATNPQLDATQQPAKRSEEGWAKTLAGLLFNHKLPTKAVIGTRKPQSDATVTSTYPYKRPPRKRMTVPLPVPAVVRRGGKRDDVSKPRHIRAIQR